MHGTHGNLVNVSMCGSHDGGILPACAAEKISRLLLANMSVLNSTSHRHLVST